MLVSQLCDPTFVDVTEMGEIYIVQFVEPIDRAGTAPPTPMKPGLPSR